MPFKYKVELMPSGSASFTSWLDTQGTDGWELTQVVPLSPITGEISASVTVARGQVLCYFISGSNP